MNSLESELIELHAAGVIDQSTVLRAVALERREIFSLHVELRLVMYTGVLLLTGGAGLFIKDNLLRLGPIAISVIVGTVAAACYGFALRQKQLQRPHSVVADYVLLLGALLLSADLGYVEVTYRPLGPHWSAYLLVLTVAHGAAAYAFASPLLLSAALTALAGWFGVTSNTVSVIGFSEMSTTMALRGFAAAAAILAWRATDRRLWPATRFSYTFDQFSANLAFWAALAWCAHDGWRLVGLCVVAALATVAIWHGLSSHNEAFVVYAVGYSALASSWVVAVSVHDDSAAMALVLLIVTAAALALWRLHERLSESGT